MRGLAREVVRNLLPREVIFEAYSITDADWEHLAQNRAFKDMLEEAHREWNSSLSTRERIDLKTAVILEEMLPEMAKMLVDPKFSDNAKVELFKSLQKGVGIGLNGKTEGVSDRVSITINMGDDKQLRVEHTRPPIDLNAEDQ